MFRARERWLQQEGNRMNDLLDEYLGPLLEGIWEVIIPKNLVPGPLDPTWVKSSINIPKKGTLASYRKGRYHAHETLHDWRVHLDRYDPRKHPVWHLVDDAPLLLMVTETMATLIGSSRKKAREDTAAALEGQKTTWRMLVIAGGVFALIGALILIMPRITYSLVIGVIVPLLFIFLGIITIWKGCSPANDIGPGHRFGPGIGIIAIGIVWYLVPLVVWTVLIFGLLAAWMFASAVVGLARVSGGRSNITEGYWQVIGIGLLSLLVAVLIVILPGHMVVIFMILAAIVLILLGIALVTSGIELRHRMSFSRAQKKRDLPSGPSG